MAENTMWGASPGEVAVVGLGLMGTPIARHLLAAGHRVTGFDVDSERMAAATAAGVSAAGNAAAAAAGSGFRGLGEPRARERGREAGVLLASCGIPPKGIRTQRYSSQRYSNPKVFETQRYSNPKSSADLNNDLA